MTTIEKIIKDELEKRKLEFEYSVILGFKQFDFGNKKHRILFEVQGDYWHGNPVLYGDGDNKRPLNDMQKKKIIQDQEKVKFAKKHNLRLFYIWEKDVRNKNFGVIDTIENIIKNTNKI